MERYVGKQEHLLTVVKRRKLQWFGRRNRWVKKERKINKVVDQQNQ